MKIIPFLGFLITSFTAAIAQEKKVETSIQDFNKWSLEFNVGSNRPIKPFTTGYYSSNPKISFDSPEVNHFDFGTRYMLSDLFGAKLDLGYDKITNQKGSKSLDFEAIKYSLGLQGIVNLGNLLNFSSFTKRVSILGHAGVQVSQFTPKKGKYNGNSEANGSLIYGITPQLKITNRIVLTGDFSIINNIRQHYNWDGITLISGNDNLTGSIYTTSLGLTFYLGRKNQHTDWYVKKDILDTKMSIDEEARAKITELEEMLNDVDRDGVPDYLDAQNNTPGGVIVDTKGRFIDTNRNGVPDELENISTGYWNSFSSNSNANSSNNSDAVSEKTDIMGSLIKNGYQNIYFDLNQDIPNNESTDNVFQVIQFLKNNTKAKVKLLGFSDFRGGEKFNVELSNRRAKNIAKILINSGIEESRITFDSKGIDKSSTSNDKMSLNLARRVAVILE